MFEQLKVSTSACIDDRCTIRPVLHPEEDAVTLVFGDGSGFELFLTATALQNLMQVGHEAWTQLIEDPR